MYKAVLIVKMIQIVKHFLYKANHYHSTLCQKRLKAFEPDGRPICDRVGFKD